MKRILGIIVGVYIVSFTACGTGKDNHETTETTDCENSGSLLVETENYTVYQLEDGQYRYEIGIGDSVIYRDILYKEPQITLYEEKYLEVRWGAGTGVWFCKYFDLESCFATEEIMCAHYLNDGVVALVEEAEDGERILRLYNPFSNSEYDERITIDFASENQIVNAADCLQSISLEQDGSIKVTYWNQLGEVTETTIAITDESQSIYGLWQIADVAVISEMYTGTTLDGWAPEDLYDPEAFIGYELEYGTDFFRLGDEIYKNPEYVVTTSTIDEFNEGGRFWNPDLYTFIEEENIVFDNADMYIAEIPIAQYKLKFKEEVGYGQYDFIPMGTQCVQLNENTLLVGLWGKVMVAYRVDENVRAYDSFQDFPYENMQYIDDATYTVLKQEYDSIGFAAEFLPGDEADRELYLEKYAQLVRGELSYTDIEFGEESYLCQDFEADVSELKECTYYFFDIEGDNKPELCIQGRNRFQIFKYDETANEIIGQQLSANLFLMGTQCMGWNREGVRNGFYRYDEEGNRIQEVYFMEDAFFTNGEPMFMVTFPDYADGAESVTLTEAVKKQAYYDREADVYYFWVTQEQYEELTADYFSAWELAKTNCEQVKYTYEELFGGIE